MAAGSTAAGSHGCRKSWLQGAWLQGAWLQGAWLQGAWLQEAWLQGGVAAGSMVPVPGVTWYRYRPHHGTGTDIPGYTTAPSRSVHACTPHRGVCARSARLCTRPSELTFSGLARYGFVTAPCHRNRYAKETVCLSGRPSGAMAESRINVTDVLAGALVQSCPIVIIMLTEPAGAGSMAQCPLVRHSADVVSTTSALLLSHGHCLTCASSLECFAHSCIIYE